MMVAQLQQLCAENSNTALQCDNCTNEIGLSLCKKTHCSAALYTITATAKKMFSPLSDLINRSIVHAHALATKYIPPIFQLSQKKTCIPENAIMYNKMQISTDDCAHINSNKFNCSD